MKFHIEVLFEDHALLALNKPAGLSVQGGTGAGLSLDAILARRSGEAPRLVHRLDRDTSGVLVTAKTREAAAACAALFAARDEGLKKRYLAACAGLTGERGTIDETLLVKGREREARTRYTRRAFAGEPAAGGEGGGIGPCSLLELEPATGRTHQIRRHLARLGHPVLGDDKYGDFALNRVLRKTMGLKRLLLHAVSLYLPPSLVEGGVEIRAPLPDYFREFLERTGLGAVP
ncbi:MAG: RluA family pseudouridine synthase [Treponema sp.]|nr:RluA family pseudouridine synthase [Treponema sp.]